VRRRVVSVCSAATILLVAGCGAKHSRATLKDDVVVAQAKAPWQKVIDDWYDGHIDQQHSCAAVREAIDHLPTGGTTYRSARSDLEAYERKVC
jgi:hypothetical protein